MDFLIHHMLLTSASRYPDKEAVVHGSKRLAYQQVAQRVSGLASGLRHAGLNRGDRVGIYLDPSIEQALSIFAISQAGGVFVPANTQLVAQQVTHIANDCRMTGLITSEDKLATLRAVLPDMQSLRFLIVVGKADHEAHGLKTYEFDSLIDSPEHQSWRETSISKDLAAILYTSGSTGRPKGVMLSHSNVMAGASIVSTYLGITSLERILAVLPFSFDAGLNQLTTAVQQGGTIVLIKFILGREIVDMLLRERITGLAGVPTLWTLLTQPSSGLRKQPLPDLRYITNTGGAMPQPVLKLLREYLPTTQIFLMYGLTEAFRSTYLPPEELDRRPASMGKAIPDTEILVLNDQGQICRPGEVGELVHRGPTVSLGYWGNQEATDRALRPNPLVEKELGSMERVCYSGDLVKMDEDGFLYYVGRRDTMIKSSGFRISPTEVEEMVLQNGKIRQVAAVGLSDEVLGQAVKIFVVPHDSESLDTDELLTFCAEKMPRYMVPKYVEVISEMPKTSSGKVDYPSLRKRVAA